MNRRYRKTIIAGNWKMNKTAAETRTFLLELKAKAAEARWCDIVLCVPYTLIPSAVRAAKGTKVEIGAQNVHYAENGAFTGEVSCGMLHEAGVKYVIIGHSERRQYFGETDALVNKKVLAALQCGLRPIICVGESLEMRELGVTLDQVRAQVKMALNGVPSELLRKVVIAYEPIWAIGTGKTATADQADEVGRVIRECLRTKYGARCARSVSILYGGSMNPSNAAELLSMPDVDGGLIGGASLDVGQLSAIIDAANQ
ncbi:MAG TPA: triose-phosphate isomerase [Candidatus Ventrousia excrementavium]|uniref:Triosephosphate isomerase n=1 Tax=Candidatus Ventrousia excrementavium TaxID=2840961 RepID=A0A9D1LMD2_9CLOT|nr:triose-phosphate isomerase [Candidatus Ventrousia excrementavium]